MPSLRPQTRTSQSNTSLISPECHPSWIENGNFSPLSSSTSPRVMLSAGVHVLYLHEQYIVQFISLLFSAESLWGCNSWDEAFSCLLQHSHSFPGITGGKMLSANIPKIFRRTCCLFHRPTWRVICTFVGDVPDIFFLDVCGREGFDFW